MGSKGDAYDNAVAESFFATIKKELVHRQSWPSRRDLSSAVFDYIEAFYNRQRRHSTLGYLSQPNTRTNTNNQAPPPDSRPPTPRNPGQINRKRTGPRGGTRRSARRSTSRRSTVRA
jgi:transposase InsO family protein